MITVLDHIARDIEHASFSHPGQDRVYTGRAVNARGASEVFSAVAPETDAETLLGACAAYVGEELVAWAWLEAEDGRGTDVIVGHGEVRA